MTPPNPPLFEPEPQSRRPEYRGRGNRDEHAARVAAGAFFGDSAARLAWVYYILLILICFGSLGLVAVTLPGLWVMTAACAVYALLTHTHFVGRDSLIALFVLSLGGEVLDYTAGGAMAKRGGRDE